MAGNWGMSYVPLTQTRVTPMQTSSSGSDYNDDGDVTKGQSAVAAKKEEFRKLVKESEQSNPDYKNIVINATQLEDVPNDCWGALIFILVQDIPDLRAGRAVMEGKVRVFFVLFLFLVNICIQGVLLFFIGKLLMMPSMLDTQDVYRDFHQQAFTNGVSDAHSFGEMSKIEKRHLCGMALSQGVFVRIILFLWVTSNAGELRDNTAKTIGACTLPRLPDGMDTRLMVRRMTVNGSEMEYCVICLNMKGKVGLLLLVFIPKFIIAVILTITGCLWLASSDSIADLILNSLALAFVVKVDELIAVVFFPRRFQGEVTTLGFMLPSDPDEDDEEKRMHNSTFEFVVCGVAILLTLGLVELVIHYQPVIPAYDYDVYNSCKAYLDSQMPWCMPWQMNCFPYD